MYISNKQTVQQDLKAATDDYSKMVERLIDKHASMNIKRAGGKLEVAAPVEVKPSTPNERKPALR